MHFIKPININTYASAVRKGQIKLQAGQLVYTDDRDPVLSVYVSTTGKSIHCIHGATTKQAQSQYRAYKTRIKKIQKLQDLRIQIKQLKSEL